MPRTARKRQPARTSDSRPVEPPDDHKDDSATTEPTTATEPTHEPTTSPVETNDDPAATLGAAYWFAIDERDVVTGTIPAAPLDAVAVAYRAVPKRSRGDVATALSAEAAQRMVKADGTFDAGLAVAMGKLSALFAQVNAERSVRPAAAPHDPVPGVAGMLAAFDLARDGILANLTDDQRARIDQVDTATDPTAQATGGTTLVALARISQRVLNGRKGSARSGATGARSSAPGRDLGQLIRDVLAKSDGPVLLATIAREHDVSTGALDNRWTKENTNGVESVRDATGRKAFQLA